MRGSTRARAHRAAAFIPLAEETGSSCRSAAGLREACRQAAGWQRRRGPDAPALTITVNISGRQLSHPGLVGDVAEALDLAGLPAHCLVLEITETVIMQDTAANFETLHALKALGVRLAIDDFGTGYSSLGYLQKFPVDIIKIDKAFVDGVARGGSHAALAARSSRSAARSPCARWPRGGGIRPARAPARDRLE